MLDCLVVDIDTGKKLRDDLNPDLQINDLESLSQLLLYLRQVAVLEPDLEQAEGRLKCLRFGGGRGLRAEEELLNQASCGTNDVRDVFLSNELLLLVI